MFHVVFDFGVVFSGSLGACKVFAEEWGFTIAKVDGDKVHVL